MENPFMGVWRRDYICFDDGPKETQQQVLWIQAERYFGDVRSSTWLVHVKVLHLDQAASSRGQE